MVISPRLKGWPLPPARPRSITRPVSGLRSQRCSGFGSSAVQAASSRAGSAWLRQDIQVDRSACKLAKSGICLYSSRHLDVSTNIDPTRRTTQAVAAGVPADPREMSKSIARGQGIAVWRQIAESRAADVRARPLKPGQRLATQLRRAERFA